MPSHRIGVRIALTAALGLMAGIASLHDRAGAQEVPGLEPPTEGGHRALRDNAPVVYPVPTEPAAFPGFPDAPAFEVVSRQGDLTFQPCATCHGLLPLNRQPRKLFSPHPAALDHGDGQLWCLDCHNAEERNSLRTLYGEAVSFDDAYLVCGPCHYQPQQDWYFGAHGKRVENWNGERQIYSCTHCHNPHDPAVKPRAPEPPPPVRKGLQAMHHGAAPADADESNRGPEGSDE